jgi:hypothetical protein
MRGSPQAASLGHVEAGNMILARRRRDAEFFSGIKRPIRAGPSAQNRSGILTNSATIFERLNVEIRMSKENF